MAHYAKVENEFVTQVIVAEQDFIDTQEGTWVQTSYNTRGGKHYDQENNEDDGTPLRKNYAGRGYTYDLSRDAFIPPQPHTRWTLNETTCMWDAPVAYPDDGKDYIWNEVITNWTETT